MGTCEGISMVDALHMLEEDWCPWLEHAMTPVVDEHQPGDVYDADFGEGA